MEELLKQILAGQEDMKKQISNLTLEVKNVSHKLENVEETVNRIENHQEHTVIGMLTHIKKEVEKKENQIQVLNRRLFDVEAKAEEVEQ